MEFYPNPTKSDTEYPVSIPNGMEFYLNNIASAASPKKVSIPNGMEFYLRFGKG